MPDPDFTSTSPPYEAIAEAVMAGIMSQISLDAVADTGLNGAGKFVTFLLKFLQRNAIAIAEDGGRLLSAVEEPFLPIFAAFLTPIVANMFGAHLQGGFFSSKGDVAGRENAARALVDAYIRSLMGENPGELTPSIDGARRVASASVHAALEGMFAALVPELVGEMVPWEWMHFKEITKLPEEILDVLGVNRLVRRALTPLVQAVAATPMQWHVNKLYRPSLLAESMAVQRFLRGKWTRPQLDEEMARNGWSADRIQAHIDAQGRFLSLDDTLVLQREASWSGEQVLQSLRDQGYDELTAQDAVAAATSRRLAAIHDDSLGALKRAYAERELTDQEFGLFLRAVVKDSAERAAVEVAAKTVRDMNRKRLSHAEVRTCVKKQIVTTAYYRAWLVREGYHDEDAAALELLLRTEISEEIDLEEHRRQQDAERAAEKQAREDERALRKKAIDEERALHRRGAESDLERAVVRGLVTADRLAEVLRLKYDPDTVSLLLELVEDERLAYLAQLQRAEEARQRAARKNIDVGALERAVYTHILTTQEFRARLEQLGFEPADAALLEATVAATLADRDAVKEKRHEAEQRAAVRHIDLGRAELLVRRGVYTLHDYDGLLKTLDFADADRAAMLDYLQLLMNDDAKREQERRDAEAKLKIKGISLEQFRRAVILGAMTRGAYEQFLVAQGFTADAQIALLADLDDAVAEAERARRRRTEAEVRSGRPDLPLSTVARAARLGLIPPAAYEARLVAAGYDREDIAIERDLLVFEIADLAAAKKRRDELEAQRATPELSLAPVAQAVKLGVATIEQYRARAITLGYAAADVTLLVKVLEQELQAMADARKRRAAIEAELHPRNLSIAQLEQAVKDGLMTIDQFVASVQALGYLEDDAELLAALLADEMTAAADKGGTP